MREIIFRGKTEQNEWVEGDLLRDKNATYIFPRNRIKRDVNFISNFIKVNHETVGQFTGLTDKNNKKIFEGDIITEDEGLAGGVVEFIDGAFRVRLRTMKDCHSFIGGQQPKGSSLGTYTVEDRLYYKVEVIGNKTDNPELIQTSKP